MCAGASMRSILAAQNLNSGILPNGSSAGLVSRFAAASTNANGMNTTPSGMASSWRTASSTAPRRPPHHVARRDAELGNRAARHIGDRPGLQCIECSRAPGHRAGMPVLKLPAGCEHERILRVRMLVGRQDARWHELATAILGGKAIAEHHVVPRLVRGVGRISDGALLFDAVP